MRNKKRPIKVALIGNPNSGKSTLFNALTGLNQKISNYPGVTVDKKSGTVHLSSGDQIELIDFPGIYSLYPNSSDERIVVETLTNPLSDNYPDAILYIAAAIELEKHFLLASQLKELNIPILFCLSMSDIGEREGIKYDTDVLSEYIDLPVIEVSTLTGTNIDALKYRLIELVRSESTRNWTKGYKLDIIEKEVVGDLNEILGEGNTYRQLLIAHHYKWLGHLTAAQRINIGAKISEHNFESIKYQINETLGRYNLFGAVIKKSETRLRAYKPSLTQRIDDVITHKYLGAGFFFLIMFLVFQSIYAWAEAPMTWIEEVFSGLSMGVRSSLPTGWFTDLLADGIIAGLGGIMVFLPQITILFVLIAILEEIGYMSRAVFMFDSIMQRVGLNGRSIVALVSSGACAIPAIMSTRTISNWKERLITILVTPLISCSARIPVYTVLVGFVVPDITVGGVFNSQGLAFFGLYMLGIVAALSSSYVFKKIIKSSDHSFLMIELPEYRKPMVKNVLLTVKEKVGSFIKEAGQVILVISIVLWFLASYGPGTSMEMAEADAINLATSTNLNQQKTDDLIASYKLESSYAGHLGKFIEPAIRPLGYDWKIGIALITSFAAREVFVGTMATIYSVGSNDDELSVRERLGAEINPDTGGPRYDMPTSLSLLLFYVFAMQCMSTLAVTKRETKSWKWPAVQFFFMGALAYLSSFMAYQLLS